MVQGLGIGAVLIFFSVGGAIGYLIYDAYRRQMIYFEDSGQ